jgi:hypothetical protein
MFIAYTDRVNISVASVAMREQLGWTQTVKGIVPSSFFIGYMHIRKRQAHRLMTACRTHLAASRYISVDRGPDPHSEHGQK